MAYLLNLVKFLKVASIKSFINLILNDEIGWKVLIKKPTKTTKKIRIKFDRKNPMRIQFNEKNKK
jgi:hypothetical protein